MRCTGSIHRIWEGDNPVHQVVAGSRRLILAPLRLFERNFPLTNPMLSLLFSYTTLQPEPAVRNRIKHLPILPNQTVPCPSPMRKLQPKINGTVKPAIWQPILHFLFQSIEKKSSRISPRKDGRGKRFFTAFSMKRKKKKNGL